MAEKIVSPGVFTKETDLSFLPQGIGEIGAAIVGATKKGPAFIPTIVESFSEFEQTFGTFDETTFVPYTVHQYLKHAGRITILRTLGLNGFTYTDPLVLTIGTTTAAVAASADDTLEETFVNQGDQIKVNTDASTQYIFEIDVPDAYTGNLSTNDPDNKKWYVASGSTLSLTAEAVGNAITASALGNLGSQFTVKVNGAAGKLEFTSSQAGEVGNSKSITMGGIAGVDGTTTSLTGGVNASGGKVAAILAPSSNAGGTSGFGANCRIDTVQGDSAEGTAADFNLTISSSTGLDAKNTEVSVSLNPSNDNWILNTIGDDPNGSKPLYVYRLFENTVSSSVASDAAIKVGIRATTNVAYTGAESGLSTKSYKAGQTPLFLGQNGETLFKLYTKDHGTNANSQYNDNIPVAADTNVKISIRDIKPAGSVAGSDFGQFTVLVRKVTDTDSQPVVLESFQGVNLDPDSKNFILKAIGDRYIKSISSDGKITYGGDYPNKSKYIYIGDFVYGLPKAVIPVGHQSYYTPTPDMAGEVPYVGFSCNQVKGGVTNTTKNYHGIDFANKDSRAYMDSIPDDAVNSYTSNAFSLITIPGTTTIVASGSILLTNDADQQKKRKFTVGFQGGFDGYNPARSIHTGQPVTKYGKHTDYSATSALGYAYNTTSAEGYLIYKQAFNTLSNPDEWDINMLLTPGLTYKYHDNVIKLGIEMCEDRGDSFYVIDNDRYNDDASSISTAVSAVEQLDTNYAATYFPWVKILDPGTSKPTWTPPSVVLAGTIAYTDKVAHEWFAPAGLNRGGLTDVLEAQQRLTHAERDELYEGRVNPIASFPGQGVVVWGQKTLQGKPSALDRVNVRRLLIRLKKFIASTTRFLVFEQNNAATRNRFLNIVNPFLESVQSNSGLSAFRVVMDESNNTPDVVDRNQMVGQIFVQPTRTAEFIVLDFVILPTGAAFPE